MNPVFTSEVLLAVIGAGVDSATEICGILRGDGPNIVRADTAANVAADPARHFEIDPAALLAAHRDARRPGAVGVAGWYHSHPSGDPAPSVTDAAQAAPDGMLWLIVGGNFGRLWRAVPDGARHGRFDPVRFDVVQPNRVDKSCAAVQMEVIGRTLSSVTKTGSPR
jgi:proteasome lid subunit RPN8/RPN11